MKDFLDYDIKYPDLVLSIVDYFSIRKGEPVASKNIKGFIESYKVPDGESPIQPDIVGKICDRLCDCRRMICLKKEGAMCLFDCYCCNAPSMINLAPAFYYSLYNSIVYGFEYIYRNNLSYVQPIVSYSESGQSIGTCFRMFNGIVTAKHCLTDGDQMAIRGYKGELLNNCKIYVSKNENIDLAYIETGEKAMFNMAEPHVLDDVLVMGYPKVSFFLDFCTAEKATISSIANIRMTPTMGSIAAKGELYFPKGLPKLLLITARIRGGNSGGPVINNNGLVVGVATGIPSGEGFSDDNVGYGMAYPIQAVESMISEGNTQKFDFRDFPD